MHSERPRYALWRAGARPVRQNWLARLGFAGFGLGWLVILTATNFPSAVYSVTIYVLVGLLAPSYVLILIGMALVLRDQKRRVPAHDEPAVLGQFPVVVVFRREVVYGSDEGMVSFVDGRLFFRGRNQEFAIRKEDISLDPDYDGPTEFEFVGPAGTHRAQLRPLSRGFRQAWLDWRFTRETPEGEPLFPPTVPLARDRTSALLFGYAGFEVVTGLVSFHALPFATFCHVTFATMTTVYVALRRDAFRRITGGLPPGRPFLGLRRVQNGGSPPVLANRRAPEDVTSSLTCREGEDRTP